MKTAGRTEAMDRQVAVHEAGHLTAAWHLEVPWRTVTIDPGPGFKGRVEFWPRTDAQEQFLDEAGHTPYEDLQNRVRRFIETRMMVSLAGGLAASVILGIDLQETGMAQMKELTAAARERLGLQDTDVHEVIVDGDEMDATLLAHRINNAGDDAAGFFCEWMLERARTMVDEPHFRARVEAAADVLQKHRTLSRNQLIDGLKNRSAG